MTVTNVVQAPGFFEGGGIFQQTVVQPIDQVEKERERAKMDELIQVIQTVVAPDLWKANGGKGTIAAFDEFLIIRNSLAVHQQISGKGVTRGEPLYANGATSVGHLRGQ